jgi:hypothetical protein
MNPFNYISIAQGDNFYDRVEETKRIVDTLQGGNNLVLFAPRRYGKTSLVFRAMELLERQGISCVYFDLMPVYSLESFAELYLQVLYNKLSGKERLIQMIAALKSIRPKMSFDAFGKPEFGIEFVEPKVSTATIAQLLELPEKIAQEGKRLVVVMDEFQEIRKFHKFGLEALLRSKIQLQHHANYLFLGSKTHIIQDMFMDKNKPFYNSAMTMQISALPERETIDFITSRFASSSIRISEQQCLYILSRVENIPYYIQLLCAEIWQYMMPDMHEVTNKIIDECFARVVELKSDYYFERTNRLSALQKRLLVALTKTGQNIYSANFITNNQLVGASSLQKAVAVLLDEGIIDKNGNTYSFCNPFYKQYIINYAS